MFKAKHWGVAAAMVLVAVGAMASNFRAADQVYLPISGHIQGGSSVFVSDVFISNLSTDAVVISLIYGPQNGKNETFRTFPNKITLNAGERKEYIDFYPTVLPEITNPFGVLVFNACKSGSTTQCAPDPVTGENADFRPISVESRIYAIPVGASPATSASNGQDMPGIPWYNFVSSTEASAGLDKVFITGFRSNTGYRGNLGVVNASQFSTTQLTATLKDGATGNIIGTPKVFSLPPLTFEQPNISAAFGGVGSGTNLYVEIAQTGAQPTNDAAGNGCPDGCPAYLAFGSLLDNQTTDPTTLEAQYSKALNTLQIACIYSPSDAGCSLKAGGKVLHRAVRH